MRFIWSAPLLATLIAAHPFVTNEVNSVSYQGTSSDGVDQFQGIFFAEDTSGANRFVPPKPYLPPHGTVVQATAPGAACPQATPAIVTFMSEVDNQSENCLSLRIARPANLSEGQRPLPVMVYLYGGGSILGEAYDQLFNPVGLIQQSVANGQPIIYVAMNYRVGIFGFAAAKTLRDAKAENVGLRDQYAALEWIRDNIAAFGGDPNRVTLSGQSFGGIAVGLQIVAYGGERKALFHQGIMSSGGISVDRSDTFAVKNTAAVAEKLGCSGAGGTVDDAAVACLRETPLDQLLKAELDQATGVKPPFGFAAFSAVVDGDFIPDQPTQLYKDGRFSKEIPILATWAADDGSMSADTKTTDDSEVIQAFAPYFPNLSDAAAAQLLSFYPLSAFEAASVADPRGTAQFYRTSRIVRDIDPVCPIITFTRRVRAYGATDVYLAELNTTRLTPYWDEWGVPYGISHLSDLPYLFNEAIPAPGDNSPAAFALAANYSGSIAAFVTTGSPVAEGKTTFSEWPLAYSVDSEGLTALIIGGPHGTGPATAGLISGALPRITNFLDHAEQVVMGGRFRKRPVLRSRHISSDDEARSAALEAEKLKERCAFIDSIR